MILPVILHHHKVDTVFLGAVNFNGFCTVCAMDLCSNTCVMLSFYFFDVDPRKTGEHSCGR